MFVFPIERGKIREFARAALTRNPAYKARDAVIPPTYLTIARMAWEPKDQAATKDLGFDMRRVLHASEEYVFPDGPPKAGQELHCTSRIDDRYEREGRRGGTMRFAVIVTEFRTPDGVLVAEQRSTSVETSRSPKADA